MRQAAERREVAQGISNCRQIIVAMRIYSADGRGTYVDDHRMGEDLSKPKTANEALRVLFQQGISNNEAIFGCPHSPFVPDGNIGVAPDFKDALTPGENHWILTIGLSDSNSGSTPLVYENAAVARWNPKWNADAKLKPVPGRTWTKGIIIGMNDSSVALQKLATPEGSEVPLKELGKGENLFTQHEDFDVLDVARKAD
ncbi:hypothetical protein [Roseimicrobium sp. ORNL1]|uniref:hypothetical protein n=1 Tax=Roseimicrobium sp. ORNL1 TaxID=2711231 RepID=UPI0013E0FBB3|nr:hypothetical protein [Roseimicrobium sp. ORNL1]QIF01854.1 hypothetical protein G5S37_10050 [Roseimicrobium sp. ORNL1]